jgi:hypothetical protein
MTEKNEFGYRTDKGWRFDDRYTLQVISHSDADLAKVRDDYLGAFKSEPANQQTSIHPTGLGVRAAPQQTNAPQARTGIVIKLAATHAGLITRNNGFYMPDKMRAGVGTWTEHYNKPIQLHHDDQNDPIGRVIAARYVDTSAAAIERFQNSVLRDSFNNQVGSADKKFWDKFVSDKTSFIDKLNMMKVMDSILNDPYYQGVGYIELTANITDPESIQKVLDGRYITGSVGAISDKAVCSVCNTDWLEEEHCGHRPGRLYDGKKCVVVAGSLEYDEYSFVNVPADRHSGVLGIEHIQNSVKHEDATDRTIRYFPVFDRLKEDSTMSANKTETATIKDSTEQVSTTETSVETSVEQPVVAETPPVVSIDDKVNTILDKLFTDKLSDEEAEELYQLQVAEMDPEVVEDAKLSTAKRKKLAASTFCGPGRSFPVPDCAHVTAARRLIGRYKGEGSKSTILACVARKAKAMGCDTATKDVTTKQEELVAKDSVQPAVVTPPAKQEFIFTASVDGELTDEAKLKLAKEFLQQITDKLGAQSLLTTGIELGLFVDPDELKLLTEEVAKNEEMIGDLRDQLAALRKELKAAYDDVTAVEDQLITARSEVRDMKSHQVTLLHTLDGTLTDEVKDQVLHLTDEALDTTINSLSAKVDINKIADRLNNGLSRTPHEIVDVPAGLTESAAETKPTNKPTYATQQMVDDVYRRILLSQGYAAANAFYEDAVKHGNANPRK